LLQGNLSPPKMYPCKLNYKILSYLSRMKDSTSIPNSKEIKWL
jgi:hypothetical protein